MERSELLRIENLELTFDSYEGTVYALNGVDLMVADGKILGLVGETGCGKSVTVKEVIRLNPSSNVKRGRILLRFRGTCPACVGRGCAICDGSGALAGCARCSSEERDSECPSCRGTGEAYIDLLKLDDIGIQQIRGQHIAMVFQEPMNTLNPTLRVVDQVGEVYMLRQRSKVYDRAFSLVEEQASRRGAGVFRVHKMLLLWEKRRSFKSLLAVLRLIPFVRRYRHWLRRAQVLLTAEMLSKIQVPHPERVALRYPHELSGGMRQRVLLAIALAARPTLLIADEPTTALDVTTQAQILKLIQGLQRDLRMSMILISHDLAVVAQLCDRVSVMYAGGIVETAPVDRIFGDPLHPYTQGLISSIPRVDVRTPSLTVIRGTVPNLLSPPLGCPFHPRCAFAREICRERRPPAVETEPGHTVACFIYTEFWSTNSDPVSAPQSP
ncbi:MAG: ABC transporter ATP-binding protein [Thermoplasmata archaeon]